MRLSRLHIAGFKSFPDRAELGFDDGVTAIVGPNGCGKSNVVDAITWVLGEQSAKSLRGERMEDVIFNGSDARKPTAAAEVRLKLTQVAQAAMAAATAAADALLDEAPLVTRDVEIGRRLYRSGESEYLIDGEVCRLRDVHDLLMDSGLGVKAYAVIEQGKIGQILSSRPAERRMLIEEAAGVTKYKSRRRAAELKLEAAQGNLTRIDDIIFEVEKQRGALKRQAARARRYKRLREELRRWEQVQFAHRHRTLSREIEAADARLSDARERETAAAAHLAELEATLEAVRLQLTEAEAGATAARERAHARELEIGRREQQIQFDRRQVDDFRQQAAVGAVEVQELAARREPARAAIAAQKESAVGVRLALEAAERDVTDRETDYRLALEAVQGVEREADATRAAVLAAGATMSALRQARDNAVAMLERIAAERGRLQIEGRELDLEAERVRAARADAERALADGRTALDETFAARSGAESTLTDLRANRDRLSVQASARERDLAGKEARLRSLEELEASRATFGDAARLLLGNAGAGFKSHGAVADYLVVERSFERAVDALLGDLLQHVLVEQDDDVARALGLLAERDAGRCGFVVLGEAGGPAAVEPLVVPPGARSLDSVVRATGAYADAVMRVVPRALVVSSYAAARDLSRTVSVPVATTSGEVFHRAWLVQGGSRQDVRGILETRAEMLALRDEVQAAGEAITELARELASADQAIAAADALRARLTAEQHEQEKAMVSCGAQVSRAGEEAERVRRRREVVTTEDARAREEETSTTGRHDEAIAAMATQAEQQREAEARLGDVLARLQAARDAAEQRTRLVTESRTAQATLIERAVAIQAEIGRLEDAARDLETRLSAREAEVHRIHARLEELATSIREGEQALDADVRDLEAQKVEMRELDAVVVTLREQFGTRDHGIRGVRQDLERVRGDVMQAEVARATAASDLTHLATACVEAVGIGIEEVVTAVAAMEAAGELVAPARRLAAAASPEEGDEDEAGGDELAAASDADSSAADETGPALTPDQVIADLRKKIDRLGPVNMMAIEQFDDLETRHTFLTAQRKDLLDSIAQTGEAIRKIDKTTRERFAEAFAAVNTHFEKTFTTLFGGGRAGLVLIDQENDQESGIDIIAQPPGKRLQNVQLLSGGEKALTAMGLMFAIFKYRPSPFCLLDEIDAPLDDANIGRFVEMLQGMQEHTQFILITHNRKTMEIANRLYGVTMEEPGVSKLISLQLN